MKKQQTQPYWLRNTIDLSVSKPPSKNGSKLKNHEEKKQRIEPIINIKNFSVSAKNNKRDILQNINLTFYKNQITAIIGPSGCGKTTFLKSLNMIIDKRQFLFSGSIFYNDEDILKTNQIYSLRKKIGMVFQKPIPFEMSVAQNICFGLKVHGIFNRSKQNDIIQKNLQTVGLFEEIDGDVSTDAMSLSGGQQQRLCIARTISLKPDIILLDEPTSALDPHAALKIERVLLELKQRYTIIFVTHSLHQAARIADYTVFMKHGKIIESNSTKKLFNHPSHVETKKYINLKQ